MAGQGRVVDDKEVLVVVCLRIAGEIVGAGYDGTVVDDIHLAMLDVAIPVFQHVEPITL
jgi:hypothetical protein